MGRNLKTSLIILTIVALAAGVLIAQAPSSSEPAADFRLPVLQQNRAEIHQILAELERSGVEGLEPIEIRRFEIPDAGIDVMRVRLEETYLIDGIGEDTVELTGWVAVAHASPRPVRGETEVAWGRAVSDTEFVGLELRGVSELFGPVHVSIDRSKPAVGAVGKLSFSFLPRVSLDLAYSPYRKPGSQPPVGIEVAKIASTSPVSEELLAEVAERRGVEEAEDMEAQTKEKEPTREMMQKEMKAQKPGGVGGPKEQIEAVLRGVWGAIHEKDTEALLKYFSKEGGTFYNAGLPTLVSRSGEEYVRGLSRMFESIKSIRIVPNDDLKIRVAKDWAVASVTGRNEVVDLENRRATGPWRWTVELGRERDRWVIVGDHLSFFHDPKQPLDPAVSAAACVANVSVAVVMPDLDLRLATSAPVTWYSEVETIPPVGETASVSMTPTVLIADGRPVGTLEHGVVKFREVVRHIPLRDPVGE